MLLKEYLRWQKNNKNTECIIEKTIVDRQTEQSGNGQIWGGALTVLFGMITCFLGYTGHDGLAGTIGTTTIISLVIVFVLRKVPEGNKKKKR